MFSKAYTVGGVDRKLVFNGLFSNLLSGCAQALVLSRSTNFVRVWTGNLEELNPHAGFICAPDNRVELHPLGAELAVKIDFTSQNHGLSA